MDPISVPSLTAARRGTAPPTLGWELGEQFVGATKGEAGAEQHADVRGHMASAVQWMRAAPGFPGPMKELAPAWDAAAPRPASTRVAWVRAPPGHTRDALRRFFAGAHGNDGASAGCGAAVAAWTLLGWKRVDGVDVDVRVGVYEGSDGGGPPCSVLLLAHPSVGDVVRFSALCGQVAAFVAACGFQVETGWNLAPALLDDFDDDDFDVEFPVETMHPIGKLVGSDPGADGMLGSAFEIGGDDDDKARPSFARRVVPHPPCRRCASQAGKTK